MPGAGAGVDSGTSEVRSRNRLSATLLKSAVNSLKGDKPHRPEGPGYAVCDAGVSSVEAALLEQLSLVLDQQLDPLDRGRARLGHSGRRACQTDMYGHRTGGR